MSDTLHDPVEYGCLFCGKSVWVRPYTDDEVDLVGDWEEDGDETWCGDCARRMRAADDDHTPADRAAEEERGNG